MKLRQTLAENPALKWLLVWGAVIVAVVIAIRVFAKKPTPVAKPTGITTSDQHGSEPVGGIDLTIINPAPVTGGPSGSSSGGTTSSGGSSGGTPVPNPAPTPQKPPIAVQAPVYVSVGTWTPINPPWNSYLAGIAGHYGLTLSQLLAFGENAKYRAHPNLIHPGDKVRVK